MHSICFSAVHPPPYNEQKGHREETAGKLGNKKKCIAIQQAMHWWHQVKAALLNIPREGRQIGENEEPTISVSCQPFFPFSRIRSYILNFKSLKTLTIKTSLNSAKYGKLFFVESCSLYHARLFISKKEQIIQA